MLRFTGSFLFILFLASGISFGQSRWIPSAYRLGVDVIGLGHSFITPGYNHYEINNDLQFGKYFFSVDLGTVYRNYDKETFNYQYEGRFFRTGLDLNLIPNDPDNNVIFFGLRYGRAFFNDNMQFAVEDRLFGSQQYNYENNSLRGRWLEACGGMKIRVWNNFFLGYTMRLKFASIIRGESDLIAYELPGYGKSAKSSIFGFNYHVFYRIPITK